jgi:hypothetical protein
MNGVEYAPSCTVTTVGAVIDTAQLVVALTYPLAPALGPLVKQIRLFGH